MERHELSLVNLYKELKGLRKIELDPKEFKNFLIGSFPELSGLLTDDDSSFLSTVFSHTSSRQINELDSVNAKERLKRLVEIPGIQKFIVQALKHCYTNANSDNSYISRLLAHGCAQLLSQLSENTCTPELTEYMGNINQLIGGSSEISRIEGLTVITKNMYEVSGLCLMSERYFTGEYTHTLQGGMVVKHYGKHVLLATEFVFGKEGIGALLPGMMYRLSNLPQSERNKGRRSSRKLLVNSSDLPLVISRFYDPKNVPSAHIMEPQKRTQQVLTQPHMHVLEWLRVIRQYSGNRKDNIILQRLPSTN
jgi:hypothetical protein